MFCTATNSTCMMAPTPQPIVNRKAMAVNVDVSALRVDISHTPSVSTTAPKIGTAL